jgi:hypothetical protein
VLIQNDSINRVDFLGLWQLHRSKRLKRATAIPDDGDTIASLALKLNLNPSQYKKWLKTIGPTKMPTSSQEPIKSCSQFSIPNTVFIDFGKKDWLLDSGLIDSVLEVVFDMLENETKPSLEAEDFHVELSRNVTASTILGHLADQSIYKYYYAGHGAAENNGVINVVPEAEGVTPGQYTQYGISLMYLASCGSAAGGLPALIRKGAYSLNQWQWNVSPTGIFMGYKVGVGRGNLEDISLDRGYEKPPGL